MFSFGLNGVLDFDWLIWDFFMDVFIPEFSSSTVSLSSSEVSPSSGKSCCSSHSSSSSLFSGGQTCQLICFQYIRQLRKVVIRYRVYKDCGEHNSRHHALRSFKIKNHQC